MIGRGNDRSGSYSMLSKNGPSISSLSISSPTNVLAVSFIGVVTDSAKLRDLG